MITNISLEDGSRLAYSYDELDRLTGESRSVMTNQEYAISYGWDEVGNRTVKTNGASVVNYSYSNGCNRLTGWTATGGGHMLVSGCSSEAVGTNSALGQLYVSNSVSSAAVTPSVSGTNFQTVGFSVQDGTQQVIAAIGDAAGNVGRATNTITVSVFTNAQYGYSEAGCVTSITYRCSGFTNTTALTWDGLYQLTAVATNGVACERNGFDALGRRVWNWDGNSTNYFVYDGAQIIADLNSTGGLIRAYTWGPGIDNLLAMTVYTGATAVTYYPLTDHQGTIHALVNSSGSVVESYRFDAWGRVLGAFDNSALPIPQSAFGNRYLWQGREYSWRTGLYSFRARWYDPITGRWLSNDPIGISGGLNQYVFCGNNPVNFVDPFGLLSQAERKELEFQLAFAQAKIRQLKNIAPMPKQIGERDVTPKVGGATTPLPFGFSIITIATDDPYMRQAIEAHEQVHRRQWRQMYKNRWRQRFWRAMRPTEWYTARWIEIANENSYEIEAYNKTVEVLERILNEDPYKGPCD